MNTDLQKRIYEATGTLIDHADCGHGYLECYAKDGRWVRFKPFAFDPHKFIVEIYDEDPDSDCECELHLTESELCEFINNNTIPRHALVGQKISISGKYWKDEHPSVLTKIRRAFFPSKDEHWRPGDITTVQYRGMTFKARCVFSSEGYDDLLCGCSAAGSDWLLLN